MRPINQQYDAVVLGSGVGGCCAAALLAHQGKRVLLAEKRSYLGGRFSTVNRVTGCQLRYQQQSIQIQAPIVVSNLGPTATASMVPSQFMEDSYNAQLEKITPTAILWLHFAADELLMDYSAIGVGCSRRVNMIDVPSLEAGGVAPPGKHLYTVGTAPLDSINPGDIKAEFAAVVEYLREIFPNFDEC